jgi:hypothetical protein
VAIGLPVSFYAVVSLLVIPMRGNSIRWEIGVTCALLCSMASFFFCWSAAFAYFIRKYNLPPKACKYSGWPFLLAAIPMFAAYFLISVRYGGLAAMSLCAVKLTSDLCRKLAYPAVRPKQPFDPELGPTGIF